MQPMGKQELSIVFANSFGRHLCFRFVGRKEELKGVLYVQVEGKITNKKKRLSKQDKE